MVGGVVAAIALAAYVWILSRAHTVGTPTSIMKALRRTGRPVVMKVGAVSPISWDPGGQGGLGGFHRKGVATYSLDGPTTIRVRFVPESGPTIERSCAVPAYLQADPPEVRRRYLVARAVVTLYVLLGVSTFALTVALVGGSADVRIRIAALTALGVISVGWLAVHFALSVQRHSHYPDRDATASGHPLRAHLHRVALWTGTYVLVSAALALAWKFGNADQTHPTSWASAFLSAAIFVLATAAALAASLHHHTYIHHNGPPDS